jgi:Zn finger protein HypA/HybF involved in hydrogenase expression
MQIAVHELSVCQALLIQVAELASQQGAAAVVRITIECGPLSGVEPTLLKDAFAIMRLGGIAAAAELFVVPTVVRIECMSHRDTTQQARVRGVRRISNTLDRGRRTSIAQPGNAPARAAAERWADENGKRMRSVDHVPGLRLCD